MEEIISQLLEEMKQLLTDRISSVIKEELPKYISGTLLTELNLPQLVRSACYDYFRQSVASEVGIRLRCYNGTEVKSLFDSIWTTELDKAMKDRIREKANKAIDDVIADRLKKL